MTRSRSSTLILTMFAGTFEAALGADAPGPVGDDTARPATIALDRAAILAQSADAVPEPKMHTGIFGLPAAPLTEPLVTDRPDFTESTDAVPAGHVQLEVGYTFTYDREDGARTKEHAVPQTLLRVGLVDDVELRIGWSGVTFLTDRVETTTRAGRPITVDQHDSGGGDMDLGFKFKFLEQDGLVPHFGVITAISLPTGTDPFTGGDVDPVVVLLWAYDITDSFAVAGNVLLAVPTSDSGRFFQAGASLTAALALTDRVGTYVEYFGLYPSNRGEDAEHNLNAGFTYLITDNLQLDCLAGFGLNEQAPDFFTGAGISVRY